MTTDTTPYSVPAVWSRLYNELKGTAWDDYDLDPYRYWHNEPADTAPVVNTLKTVYDLAQAWTGVDPEDAVLAVLKAAYRHHGSMFLTPGQVQEMTGKFTIFYAEFDEPLENYLHDYYNDISLDWLNNTGRREIEAGIIRDGEIWIKDEPDLSGVWVFDKP